MKILLIWPKYPETFWSFKYALKFISKKAAFPPLGLLTVAAMLPEKWQKRLVDMNVEHLNDEDLKWADYIFISGMIVQRESIKEVMEKCKRIGKAVVAGGPFFTNNPAIFKKEIDHFVLGEAEDTLNLFLKDLRNGYPKETYQSNNFPSLEKTPPPLWELINFKNYASMSIQYSRGCPFNCEFCDITILNGRMPRTKNKEQILRELNNLYNYGWRGSVFFVDDNFIGNKEKIKQDILPALIDWMQKRNYPFSFNTEASINIADDEKLLGLMQKAGFDTVFIGIETPDEKSLIECNKFQNINRNLLDSVRRIQHYGLQVQGGFIVGFDSDTPSIFERQIQFIQRSGIVTAMVGLLNALPRTRLFQRLKESKRLINISSGDNTDCSLNFIPKMDRKTLINGYKRILMTIYSPKNYYQRVKTFLKNYKPISRKRFRFSLGHLQAFLKSIFILGFKERGRIHYWGLFFWSLFKRPKLFPLAITLSIYGFHFRKVSERYIGF